MQTITDMVEEFIEATGEPRAVPDTWHDLVLEEWKEFQDEDPGGVAEAKEAADLVYVLTGYMLSQGIDLGAVFAEVHASNMTKFKGGVKRRADGKVLKGPHYRGPRLEEVIWRADVRPD